MEIEKFRYKFNPVEGYWFTSYLIKEITNKKGCFEITLDLGLSTSRVCIEKGVLYTESSVVSIEKVLPSEEDRVVVLESTGLSYEVIKYTSGGFYKLKAISINKAPTLEICGVHMHRITGTDPWKDTLAKVNSCGIRRDQLVLDTCMGLGYTSIASLSKGANAIYTFEIDDHVIWIAERNPWSKELRNERIRVYRGDVTELIYYLQDSFFHRVIHDPPRFMKSTGDLYSLEFYRELYRVLKPRGILFHYTGEPRKHGSPSILKGIKERLEKAGFQVLRYDNVAQGYIAIKLY